MGIELPEITVCLVCFARPEETKKVLFEFMKKCDYPNDKITYHIADNDTEGRTEFSNYIEYIKAPFRFARFTHSIEKRPGWGYNVNTALNQIKTKYIFLIENDYLAIDRISLKKGVMLMEEKPEIFIVRFDGTAGHNGLVYHQREYKKDGERFDYLIIDKKLSQHLNVYSNRPHLRRASLTDIIGLYPEGKSLGLTEEIYAHIIKDWVTSPEVAILDDGITQKFEHIGKSFQGTEYDVCQK